MNFKEQKVPGQLYTDEKLQANGMFPGPLRIKCNLRQSSETVKPVVCFNTLAVHETV